MNRPPIATAVWRNTRRSSPLRRTLVSSAASLTLICFFIVAARPGIAPAQDAAVQYVYDEFARLSAVVDQQGNVAVYTYDGTGNLLRIDRVNADDIPGLLGVTLVRPKRGKVGTTVEIFGKGFSPTLANNTVKFNGTVAVVAEAAPNRLRADVPTGATTGPITVTVGALTASSPSPFVIGAVFAVAPSSITIAGGQEQQFEATEDGTPTTNVTWEVNGIGGGDPTIGTISTSGLYTAPVVGQPSTMKVTISATHRDDRAFKAEAQVTVIRPDPVISAAGGVSVQVADRTTFLSQAAGGISVQVADAATFLSPPAGGVSVLVQDMATLTAAGDVAVVLVPVILQVTPAQVARNTTAQVTLTGAGFTGATAITALPAVNLTFSNLQVVGDGTATVQVTAGGTTGVWALRIATPTGSSPANGTGANLLTVTP